ncbi:LOW QUALITY PROTEIN: periodic tryptophan protein 2 homolog [Saccoglossus kowalevskii]
MSGKHSFKFSNLLGAVYRKGNLNFTRDGNTVVSPVGNRVSLFDLKNNKSETLPIEAKMNVTCVAIAPDGNTMILVDEGGSSLLCSLISKSVLHRHHFHTAVQSIKYSPDGKKIAVTKENVTLVYHAPGHCKEYNPMVLYRSYYGAYDETTSIDWTTDSKAFVIGSKDMTSRVHAAVQIQNLVVHSLGGHKDVIVGAFFENESLDVYSVSRDGSLNIWECSVDLDDLEVREEKQQTKQTQEEDASNDKEDENKKEMVRYKRIAKHYFNQEGDFNNLTAVDFHKSSHILVTGFQSGAFYLHELPEFNNIHSLSISDQSIAAVTFNLTGDWIALGCSGLGQLLVWEWQSESYVLKQQGHFNNMTCLDYSPDGQYIVTGGDDSKSSFERTLCVAYRPDGREVAVATLNCQITFFDVGTGTQTGSIEGRHDLGSGRRDTDLITAKTASKSKAFTTMCYSADGQCILASGKSKHICIYNIKEQILLKKFEISHNLSLDAMEEFLDRRKMTEFGSVALIDDVDDDEQTVLTLPGVKKGDLSSRSFKPEINVTCVRFSPTGRSWSATTTEGLLVYSLDHSMTFDPYDLTVDVTPDTIRSNLFTKDYSNALMLSFKLNEKNLIEEVVESIPPSEVELICQNLPEVYVDKMLTFVATQLECSRHLEYYLDWCVKLLTLHGSQLKARAGSVMSIITSVQKSVSTKYDDLAKLCDSNKYTMQYISFIGKLQSTKRKVDEVDDKDDTDDDDVAVEEIEEDESEIDSVISSSQS